MSIQVNDVQFKKSVTVTDTIANGGKKGIIEVKSGVRHNLFPRVTKTERTQSGGLTRFRKEFWSNNNASDEVAYSMMAYLEYPSNAGDRFYLAKGTQIDTQNDLVNNVATKGDYLWMGVGKLTSPLAGNETTLTVEMDGAADYQFQNGGYIHLTNKFQSGQTVEATVKVGDSVNYVDYQTTWYKTTASDDVNFPNGLYVGDGMVMTIKTGETNEEWIKTADVSYTEIIGNGDGTTKTFTTTPLNPVAHGTNICTQVDKRAIVTYEVDNGSGGSITKTIPLDVDGKFTGANATAGKLNTATGQWTTPLTFTLAPKIGTDITITYHENCFSYPSGNSAVINLADPVANIYAASNTFVGGCVVGGDVSATTDTYTKNVGSGGTYGDGGNLVIDVANLYAVEDTFTILFGAQGVNQGFTVSGITTGSLASGTINSQYSPGNPTTGQPYFTIPAGFFAANTFAQGDSFSFKVHPSAVPLWLKEIVPQGTAAEPYNLLVLGWYCE